MHPAQDKFNIEWRQEKAKDNSAAVGFIFYSTLCINFRIGHEDIELARTASAYPTIIILDQSISWLALQR